MCVEYCIQSKPADDYEKMPSDKMSQQNSPARAVNGYDAQQVIREGDVYPIDDKTRRHLGIVSVGNMLTFKTHKQSNLNIEVQSIPHICHERHEYTRVKKILGRCKFLQI